MLQILNDEFTKFYLYYIYIILIVTLLNY